MKFKIAFGRISSDVWANIRLRGILRELKNKKNKKILDIGCESSPYISECFLSKNEVTITDLKKESLNKVKNPKFKKIILDLTKPNNLPKNYFNVIICADVIEHIKNQDIAFENLIKLLKPNGLLVFTSPAYSKFYGTHDKMIGHYRRYDLKDLKLIAKKHNLKLIRYRYLVSLLLPVFILMQQNKKSEVVYQGKSKIEYALSPFLNFFCFIDEFLELPFGICIMGIFKKK